MLDGCTFGWKAAPLFGCLVVNPNMLRLLRTLAASRCARMKSRDMASSATRSEPSHCRVLPVDAKSSHRASWALENKSSTVCTSIEGRIIMSEAELASLAAWQNFYVIIGNAAARDHGDPQCVGCRDLHAHRSPPVSEHEPGLAGSCAGWLAHAQVPWGSAEWKDPPP